MPRTRHAIKVNGKNIMRSLLADEQIGKSSMGCKSLDWKRTYVFFSADHGLGVGHHGLLGKQIYMNTALVFPLSFLD